MSQYVRTTLTYEVLELSPLLILQLQIYQQCMQQALFFSLFFDSLLKIFLTSEHKIEILRLTVEELQALQAKGLYFSLFLDSLLKIIY